MERRLTGLRRGAACALLAVLTTTSTVVALALPVGASPAADEILSLLNRARADAGRIPLKSAPDLAAVAASHSEDMARSRTLGHNPSLRRQVDPGRAIAENVAYSSSVAGLHRVLMQSSEHRESILSPTYDEVGVGVADSGGRLWVTQVFRKSRAAAAVPAPEPTPAPDPAPAPEAAPAQPAPAPPAPAPPVPVPPPAATTSTTTSTTTVPVDETPPSEDGTAPGADDGTAPAPEGSPGAGQGPPPPPVPDGFTEVPEGESGTPSPFGVPPSTPSPTVPSTTTTTVPGPASAVSALATLLGLTPAAHSRDVRPAAGLQEIAAAALVLVVLALAFSPLRALEDPGSAPRRPTGNPPTP